MVNEYNVRVSNLNLFKEDYRMKHNQLKTLITGALLTVCSLNVLAHTFSTEIAQASGTYSTKIVHGSYSLTQSEIQSLYDARKTAEANFRNQRTTTCQRDNTREPKNRTCGELDSPFWNDHDNFIRSLFAANNACTLLARELELPAQALSPEFVGPTSFIGPNGSAKVGHHGNLVDVGINAYDISEGVTFNCVSYVSDITR